MATAARYPSRPDCLCVNLLLDCAAETEFTLRLRLPDWVLDGASLSVDGEAVPCTSDDDGFISIHHVWKENTVCLNLPLSLQSFPLPDMPDTVAFRYGPMALAGLCAEERMLYGDKKDPRTMLTADNEREWASWKPTFRLVNQPVGMRFIPLKDVGYEPYTVYFPVRPVSSK